MPDACKTPDGGMNLASAEGSMSVAKAPVLRSGITPEQTVQRSLTKASAETHSRVPRSSNSSISEFLVCLEPSSTPERSLPCVRLLTSDESLAMLEEKENKKKRELEKKKKAGKS